MAAARHRWKHTLDTHEGHGVEVCEHCETERVRDASTRTLFLYRRGRAIVPRHLSRLGEDWRAFKATFVPACPGPQEPTR